MNPVIDAIYENLKYIELIFEPTKESFKKDTKSTGDSREITVKEFLESNFPTTFEIKKGNIFNIESYSQEIDCVIIAPNHPKLATPKREVILAEGVYAAVEVKPDISVLTSGSELHRGLVQMQSVKKLKRTLPVFFTEGSVPEAFHRIPTIIFSKKSRTADDMINYMKENVSSGIFNNTDLPDMIVTLDNGIIYHTLHVEKTPFSEWVKQQSDNHKGEKYFHLAITGEKTLGIFILLLLCFKGPEPAISENILKNYIKQGIKNIKFEVFEP